MIRLVLDTNILVSALLSRQGIPAQVLLLALSEPDIQLCLSGNVFAEYEDVLRRPLFRRTPEEVDTVLGAIRKASLWVKPTVVVHGCSDPDDDIFLECAQAADAHYLVTGNLKHFPESWGGTRIVSARKFLDSVG